MSDSDFEELPDIPQSAPDTPHRSNAYIQRLGRVASRFNERTHQILNSPVQATSFANRIAQSFRTPEHNRRIVRRGRPTEILQVRIVCLRLPSRQTISRLNYGELSRFGLGNPPQDRVNDRGLCSLNLSWSREELENFIQSLFPILNSTQYELCRSQRGGRLHVIDEMSRSTAGLREVFLSGRRRLASPPTLYVRPLETINHRPMDTPTLLRRVSEVSEETARPVNESVNETRRLRQEQDEAYAESLRADRERARQQQRQEQQAAQRRQRSLYRNTELQNLRATRRAEIPQEPDQGVTLRFRFPGGTTTTRRFSVNNPMSVLTCVAGSHPDATRDFYIRLPTPSNPIASSSMTGTLADHQIDTSTTVDVQWIDSDEGHSSDSDDELFGRHSIDDEISDPDQDTWDTPPTDPHQDSPPAEHHRDTPPTDTRRDPPPFNRQQDIQPTNPRRDTPPTDPQQDNPSTHPSRDTPPTDTRRDPPPYDRQQDIQPTHPRRDTPPADPQQDVQPTRPRRDTLPTHPRREAPPTDPQEDIQPTHPRRDTPPTHSQQDNPPVPRDNHADTPRGEVTSSVLLQVSRASIVPELMDHFKESYDDQDVQVEVMGEQAVDDNGVFRDVLTAFWNGVIGRFFEGEIQSVPVLSPSVSSEMWRAMGNVLIVGFRQVGYLPLQLCLASLIFGIFGYVPSDILLQSWLETLGGFDKVLMTKVLAGDFDEEDLSDVTEIFDRFNVSENPTRDNVARLSERCANLMCVERPFYALSQMRLNRLQNFITTLPRLISIVHGLRPDGRKISTMIRTEASNTQQERILRFLRQAIRGMEQTMLRRFLRFSSGSDVINFSEINVNFVHLYGLQRRIVSHTCSVTLDVPLQYESYNEFSTELKNQLSSDVWEMDYA